MRIFVSSTFEDLREHRAAAIRVLRQLGHEVLAMEDMVAASNPPLARVIEMVDPVALRGMAALDGIDPAYLDVSG